VAAGGARGRGRRGLAVPAAIGGLGVLAAVLAGCGTGAGSSGGSPTAGQAGGPAGVGGLATLLTPPVQSSDGSAPPSGATSAPATTAAVTRTLTAQEQPFFFVTPSGNIACVLDDTEARCDIRQHSWQAPAKPADCQFDYGNGMVVTADGAGYTCVSDTVLGQQGAPVLAYGQAVANATFTCVSQPAGVRCMSVQGRGFTLAKEAVTRF